MDKCIAFSPKLARALGGINEAIFVQQLYYWSDKGTRKDGFIYKTKKEWADETTLTARQQDCIVKKLKSKGILETKLHKVVSKDLNGTPVLHYKLNIPLLQKVIIPDYDETSQSETTKSVNSYTENTVIDYTESTNTTSEPQADSQDIVDVIDAFSKFVNKACSTYYGNKSQRKACKELLAIHGRERVLALIEKVLPRTNVMIYGPVITTPVQLRDSYAKLESFVAKWKAESKKGDNNKYNTFATV